MKTQMTAATVKGRSETDINGNTVYSVPSRCHPGDVYQVVEANGHLTCACKGFQYRGKCAHLDAVAAYKRAMALKMRDTAPLYRDNRPFSIFKAS